MEMTVAVTSGELEVVLSRLNECFVAVAERLLEAADILGKLTTPQLEVVKRRFPWVGRDRIARLALFGRGLLPKHLALREKSLPASLWLRLPDDVKKRLADPANVVEVWTPSGPRRRAA